MLNGVVSPAEGPPPPRRSAPSWADGGRRQRKGRGELDPVYHHAEVYGNKAELATAAGTCRGGRRRGSAAGPGGARVAGGLGTLPTTCTHQQSNKNKKKPQMKADAAAAVMRMDSFTHDFCVKISVNYF